MAGRTTEPPTPLERAGVKGLRRPATADHFRKSKLPTKVVDVLLDPDLAEPYQAAQTERDAAARQVEALEKRDAEVAVTVIADDGSEILVPGAPVEPEVMARARERLAAAQAEVDRLTPAVEDAQVQVVLRGLGRRSYLELCEQHPPTEDDRKVGALRADSFAPALLSACLVEPELSPAEADELIWSNDRVPQWTAIMLFTMADGLCNQVAVADLGKDSTPTNGSVPSSATA